MEQGWDVKGKVEVDVDDEGNVNDDGGNDDVSYFRFGSILELKLREKQRQAKWSRVSQTV